MGVLQRFKPAAARRTHVAAAAGLWTVVGIGLSAAGLVWILGSASSSALVLAVIAGAVLLGMLKSRYVLDRTAARIVRRIESRGDGRCLGGFLSWGSWALVAGFAIGGRVLRATPTPTIVLGGIYLAVGLGLFRSGLRMWRRLRPDPA